MIIECPHWVARHFLAMRILHAWAKEPPWPARGVPVAVALYLPLVELNNKKSIAHFVEKVSKLEQFHLYGYFLSIFVSFGSDLIEFLLNFSLFSKNKNISTFFNI